MTAVFQNARTRTDVMGSPKWNEIYRGAVEVAGGLAKIGLAQNGVLISRDDGDLLEHELAHQFNFTT